MSDLSRMAKIKKPSSKKAPLSATSVDTPLESGRVDIPSGMERTRTGIQHSPEVWGNRVFGSGDRKHPHAKPC
jgi:hypothetical protein